MPRVALSLLTAAPGRVGGAEWYVRDLLPELAKGESQITTTLAVPAACAKAWEDLEPHVGRVVTVRGVNPAASPGTRALSLANLKLRRVMGRRLADGQDVVHFPIAVGLPTPPPSTPFVVTLHDVAHLQAGAHFSPLTRAYRTIAYQRPLSRAAHVVTVSEHARTAIVEHLDVDENLVTAIPHGIDHDTFNPIPSEADAAFASRASLDPFVYYPANGWPHKNHRRLLSALARSESGVHLVLTGNLYGREAELRDEAQRLGVGERLHVLGLVDRGMVPAIYRASVGLIFPSLFEGFGSPPLEAMACGRPAAVASAGSLPEVGGDAALYFDPEDVDAIAHAVDALAWGKCDGNIERGTARAESFTWSRSAARHAAIYESVA